MSRRLRMFIALELSPEVVSRAGKLIDRLKSTGTRAKWVDPRQMHITLHFLGDVDELEMPAICRIMDGVTKQLAPFDIEVGGVGAFPNEQSPRTLWIGVSRGADDLIELHRRIEEELKAQGFRTEERRFRPHLTIGRLRENEADASAELTRELAALHDASLGVVDVCEIVLFSSSYSHGAGPNGPEYDALHTADLKGRE